MIPLYMIGLLQYLIVMDLTVLILQKTASHDHLWHVVFIIITVK